MEHVDCIVIGAGVVGLACAAALARSGREVFVLEAEHAIGLHASSRNSEVIHAGIYYEPGSLKARLCREGRDLLYAYAAERGIAHRRIGKMIVATSPAQLGALDLIRERAMANGVHDLEWLTPGEASTMEPAVRAEKALHSPSTGIIDSHALMLALEGDLANAGGKVVLGTKVASVRAGSGGFVIETEGQSSEPVRTRTLINSGGFSAVQLASRIAGLAATAVPEQHLAIGHYYRLDGPSPCARLVYPVPEPGGLGVHLTLDLAGQARFGPDVRWIDQPDYAFDDSRRQSFVSAIQTYLPDIGADRLVPDYTGIRSKISGPGQAAADFWIAGPEGHGVPGLVNLFGIESPGLTSSLAIAAHVSRMRLE